MDFERKLSFNERNLRFSSTKKSVCVRGVGFNEAVFVQVIIPGVLCCDEKTGPRG